MTRKQTFSTLILSAVFVLIGFQNCSKVAVADSAPTNEKALGNGTAFTVPDSDSQPPIMEFPPVTQTPTDLPGPTPTPNPTPTPGPIADDGGKDHTCHGGGGHEDHGNEIGGTAQQGGPEDDGATTDISQSQAVALCLRGGHFGHAISGPDVQHMRGKIIIESDSLNQVDDIRGLTVIKGKTSAAAAKTIQNIRGLTVICGMSVDQVENVRGALVLVNSEVKTLKDFRGAVLMMNSEVGSTSNVRGAMKEF